MLQGEEILSQRPQESEEDEDEELAPQGQSEEEVFTTSILERRLVGG